jgi:hypothetical protein
VLRLRHFAEGLFVDSALWGFLVSGQDRFAIRSWHHQQFHLLRIVADERFVLLRFGNAVRRVVRDELAEEGGPTYDKAADCRCPAASW